MGIKNNKNIEESLLLKQFNDRECVAMGEVYFLYYEELNRFAAKLFKNTELSSSDVIHDIFIHVWQNSKVKFESLVDIKSYIYACIRNNFRNYLIRRQRVDKYIDELTLDDDYFVVGVAENEIYSVVNHVLDIIPEDCIEVISMLIDGWSMREISEVLGKPKRTVYNKRDEAIKIIKNSVDKNMFSIFILLVMR